MTKNKDRVLTMEDSLNPESANRASHCCVVLSLPFCTRVTAPISQHMSSHPSISTHTIGLHSRCDLLIGETILSVTKAMPIKRYGEGGEVGVGWGGGGVGGGGEGGGGYRLCEHDEVGFGATCRQKAPLCLYHTHLQHKL
jgi:hypothetical protein